MKQCPECKKWTLEYDAYFGRYRCFSPGCEWMPISSVERELRLLETYQKPEVMCTGKIPELETNVTVTYEEVNDVLAFDFGADEATFDLPEPDGRIIWQVAHRTDTVVGFAILQAKKLGVSEVQVNIVARKDDIERNLRVPGALSSGRPTRMLITGVAFASQSDKPEHSSPVFTEAVEKFQGMFS